MQGNFKVGDLVWAKMKGSPPWPARVEKATTPRKGQVHVYYFGSKPSHGWVQENCVNPFDEYKDQLKNVSNRSDFKVALQQIEEYKLQMAPESNENEGDEEDITSKKGKRPITNESNEKEDEEEDVSPKRGKRTKRKASSSESEGGSISKRPLKGKSSRKSEFLSSLRSEENGVNSGSLGTELLNMPSVLERPDSPVVDLNTCSELLKTKDISASTLTFGFLGLGIMGSGIVKNLVASGHTVNLWSRNPEKCKVIKEQADKMFKEGLVSTFIAPCDVMQNSHIVFSCVSDPKSAEVVAYGNCGVVGLDAESDALEGKAFVEMTGIDPQTSQKISEVIKNKGGRYLEAQIQGSRDEAEEGSLVILAAGDRSVFMDCQSCFKAMSKTALFLGDVGMASKIYLILQLMRGISLVGLAESLVLADRCGISAKDILNIFNMTNLCCPYLKNKAETIIKKDFKKVEHSIQHMQKDIKLALDLSDQLMQPLMMASAANEVYKHSRKLGYDEHDCACIYMKTRY
ncbi:cytokine-like nuclear factor N-PAC [Cylas formicarius]|uniref:cytokine-like nuclear factor N-PAC n=1 Tax=Cylas formicarius TaxID=197179 RepID=UPI0029584BF6|nr:cytokine-like nuclear factor N-PAC [Cylas formicarius]